MSDKVLDQKDILFSDQMENLLINHYPRVMCCWLDRLIMPRQIFRLACSLYHART